MAFIYPKNYIFQYLKLLNSSECPYCVYIKYKLLDQISKLTWFVDIRKGYNGIKKLKARWKWNIFLENCFDFYFDLVKISVQCFASLIINVQCWWQWGNDRVQICAWISVSCRWTLLTKFYQKTLN